MKLSRKTSCFQMGIVNSNTGASAEAGIENTIEDRPDQHAPMSACAAPTKAISTTDSKR